MQSLNHSLSLIEPEATLEKLTLVDAELIFAKHFHTPAIADSLFTQLLNETEWRQENIRVWAKLHLRPRLTPWHGDPDTEYNYSGVSLATGHSI